MAEVASVPPADRLGGSVLLVLKHWQPPSNLPTSLREVEGGIAGRQRGVAREIRQPLLAGENAIIRGKDRAIRQRAGELWELRRGFHPAIIGRCIFRCLDRSGGLRVFRSLSLGLLLVGGVNVEVVRLVLLHDVDGRRIHLAESDLGGYRRRLFYRVG